MTWVRRSIFILLVLLGLAALPVREAPATMVVPLTLEQMTREAGQIFVGRCEERASLLDENGMPATELRFQVLRGLKGVEDGEQVLIKQYGVPARRLPLREGERAILPFAVQRGHVAAERVGETLLLFLYPESPLGFTSPVGLGQGKFRVTEDGRAEQSLPALSLSGGHLSSLDGLVLEIRRILDEAP